MDAHKNRPISFVSVCVCFFTLGTSLHLVPKPSSFSHLNCKKSLSAWALSIRPPPCVCMHREMPITNDGCTPIGHSVDNAAKILSLMNQVTSRWGDSRRSVALLLLLLDRRRRCRHGTEKRARLRVFSCTHDPKFVLLASIQVRCVVLKHCHPPVLPSLVFCLFVLPFFRIILDEFFFPPCAPIWLFFFVFHCA